MQVPRRDEVGVSLEGAAAEGRAAGSRDEPSGGRGPATWRARRRSPRPSLGLQRSWCRSNTTRTPVHACRRRRPRARTLARRAPRPRGVAPARTAARSSRPTRECGFAVAVHAPDMGTTTPSAGWPSASRRAASCSRSRIDLDARSASGESMTVYWPGCVESRSRAFVALDPGDERSSASRRSDGGSRTAGGPGRPYGDDGARLPVHADVIAAR